MRRAKKLLFIALVAAGNIQLPPGAPAGAKLLLGADGAPLKGADGAYLFGVS